MTNVTLTPPPPTEETSTSTTTTTTSTTTSSSPLYLLHTPRGSFRSFPILLTAQHQGLLKDIHIVPFSKLEQGTTTPPQAPKSPTGKVPLLEIGGDPSSSSSGGGGGDEGHVVICGSHAIAKYLSSLSSSGNGGETNHHNHTWLYHGHTPLQQAQMDGWMEFALQELDIPCTVWTYPTMGYMSFHETADQKAQEDVRQGFQVLNQALTNQHYLIGTTYPTLADMVVFSSLYYPLKFKIRVDHHQDDENDDIPPPAHHMFVESFPHVMRWYHQCMDQPTFQTIFHNTSYTTMAPPPPTSPPVQES
mmetsp:Transcript_2607/g.4061  ORF Transcript_2607/g.4061 Transcript_2607/m.4061 type:complete len:304 (+) Transcript_2607:1-912(+)